MIENICSSKLHKSASTRAHQVLGLLTSIQLQLKILIIFLQVRQSQIKDVNKNEFVIQEPQTRLAAMTISSVFMK